MSRRSYWRLRGPIGLVVVALVAFGVLSEAAFAAAGTPQLTVSAVARPSTFAPGGAEEGQMYVVTVTNTGSAPTNGEPVTITEEPSAGVSLASSGASGEDELAVVEGKPAKLSCVRRTCTFNGIMPVDDTFTVRFPVEIAASGETVSNRVRAVGGGALASSMSTTTRVGAEPAGFGIADGGATTALSSVQAGAHPDITVSSAFNTVDAHGDTAEDLKDIVFDLPPGFVVDLLDTPSCAAAAFLVSECPVGTQVGVTTVMLVGLQEGPHIVPVYNLTPGPGEAAKIGFSIDGQFFYAGDITVRPEDYGGRTTFHNVTAGPVAVDNVSLTVWGDPSSPVHDPLRWQFGEKGTAAIGHFGVGSDAAPRPFFTNPTTCGEAPLESSFMVSSWQHPETVKRTGMLFGPMIGCDRLGMSPALTGVPTTTNAYSPSGLDLQLDVPQTYENAEGLVTSTLKRTVVTLPEGMVVNPSSGAGLGACTEAQYEQEGATEEPGVGCPSDAKLGTVNIVTPILKQEVTGDVYIAQPYANPFDSLLAIYVVARLPERGIIVKAAGQVEPDPQTGRLVTVFDDLPPLPFSAFTFRFNQGATSPLVTPATCGDYALLAELTSWAAPGRTLTPEIPAFSISNGFEGGTCPLGGIAPFAPAMTAGTVSPVAGSYSPLDLRITRRDGEQEITRFSSQLPPGLTANLNGVPFCPDADIQAARSKSGIQEEHEPSCPATSEIGHTLAGAGVGSVLVYAPGKLYMAGPYNGAPFSIVSITRATVGPFDLGTVVVREALRIDPRSAIVTVDAAASDPIPHIIKGIVVHLRELQVYVDRPKYVLNPTNCDPTNLAATISGSGANFASSADDVPVTVTDRFQAAECQGLKFTPSFKVSTNGKTSRRLGASLHVKLTYPKGSLGSQANMRYVKVDLPRQLPSNLKTLQKACPAKTFEADPAACDPESRVGSVLVHTQILPVPLEGPAYFVSYGAAKFPELVFVLQGYGVTVQVHAETFIDEKTSITSSTIRDTPDVPFESFELTLPQGPDAALASPAGLCKVTKTKTLKKKVAQRTHGKIVRRHGKIVYKIKKIKKSIPSNLAMPTKFIAQNGAEIKQNTPIEVTGCPKTKAKKKTVQ